ncbi:MAG: hypothetical protein AMXMBFR33_06010 [Candidatus Xenobia bacterium]
MEFLAFRVGLDPLEGQIRAYLSFLSPGSRRVVEPRLRLTLCELGVTRVEQLGSEWLTAPRLAAWRHGLLERYRPTTANRVLAGLRSLLARAGHKTTLLPRFAAPQPAPAAPLRRELSQLFEACARDGSRAGCRDAALLACLAGLGLRSNQALELTPLDLEAHHGRPGARFLLRAWMAVRGELPGPLFGPITRGGRLVTLIGPTRVAPMTSQALFLAVRKRCRQAEVRDFSPQRLAPAARTRGPLPIKLNPAWQPR